MADFHDVEHWILETPDPAVRYRYYRDFMEAGDDNAELEAARSGVAESGWGAAILRLQLPDGQWTSPGTTGRELYVPKYIAANWRLLVLSDFGLTKAHAGVDRAVRLLMDREAGPDGSLGGSSSEVCFTGNCARMFSRFGYHDDPHLVASVEWLVGAQKADGGWHCFPSDTGTLDCWEALAAFAAMEPSRRSPAVRRAIERGAEFYLERGLLREGDTPYAPWSRLHYPVHYYYDLLVGLDTLTALGYGRDPRLRTAIELLEAKRTADGTWCPEAIHPDFPQDGSANYEVRLPYYPFVLEPAGVPSRWITVGALTVLRRAGRL